MHAERKHLSVVHVSCQADSDLVLVVYRVTEQLRSSFYASMIDLCVAVWRRRVRLTETESKSGEAGDEGGERGGEREVDDGGMRAAKEESEGVMERGGGRRVKEGRASRLEGNITEPERFTTEAEDGTTHM